MSELTLETVKGLVPSSQRTLITEEFVDKLNSLSDDPMLCEQFKENFLTYISVLNTGKYKMEDYINAVKYVSLKLLGYNNTKAYAIVFPDRYEKLRKNNQQVESFASMYNKNKLVIQIYEQTMVPTYVLNAPLHQEALNTLVDMIRSDDIRGMAKVKACEAILNYTKPPEVVQGKIDINIDKSNTISELRDVTEKLAETFRSAISNNTATLRSVTETKIVNAEYEVAND